MSILNLLNGENLWWTKPDYQILESTWPKRDLFTALKSALNNRQITSIIGLRRTGKSTLLNQLLSHIIEELRSSQKNPKTILYLSFEESLNSNNDEYLRQILDYYFREILETNPRELSDKVYILFDEIQYVKNWQDICKRYYDKNPNIKFIISGSFALKLLNKDQESLAGRIEEYYVPPLNFSEFLRIKYPQKKIPEFSFARVTTLLTNNSKLSDLKLFVSEHQRDFEEFILFGQFPELITFDDFYRRYQYIERSILNRVLEQDIPKIYQIDKINEFKIFCLSLIQNTSSMYELQNLCAEIGLSEITASRYLQILKSSFLLETISTTSKSAKDSNRAKKKIYSLSPNFTTAILSLEPSNPLLNTVMGHLVENYVFQRLQEHYQYISFYRKGEKEIDFVCGKKVFRKSDLDFIEVKYREKIRADDLKVLVDYIRKNKINHAYVFSKNILQRSQENEQVLNFIPACLV